MTLWEVDIEPAEGQPDLPAAQLVRQAAELGIVADLRARSARGFLLQGPTDAGLVEQAAAELLADTVVERYRVFAVGPSDIEPSNGRVAALLVHVLPKPGVMDSVAESVRRALADRGLETLAVRTFRKFWLSPLDSDQKSSLAQRLLANDAVEQVIWGEIPPTNLALGSRYELAPHRVPLRRLDEESLRRVSREGQLSLSLQEMLAIQAHYEALGREPSDIELETIAQTWSEHCSHKTLKGRVSYCDPDGPREFGNLLKETIFAATEEIRRRLGPDDFCVSVFQDNAGVVRFDERQHLVFKVETHNHPSAIDPYGGANTGLGGVIRDALGTGLGARPVCNTDVFCCAPPDTPSDEIPPGVLHPRRVLQGVVAGVRDYGNRMGIPTVNGALAFDPRYLANPLVFCGTVGVLPVDRVEKEAHDGDWIVAIGGRTGRDGIHGATFSSIELTEQSEHFSGGAVQIGNAITEKMVTDVLIEARDRGLFRAVTDCGAGGFSSAVGEMGAELGAEVWLDRAPLKYAGLSYTEIWISEAQERMVLAVPPDRWDELAALCASEGVEATCLGRFVATGQLRLSYEGHEVGSLSMEFLHEGRPPVIRRAEYVPPAFQAQPHSEKRTFDYTRELTRILGALNVCSKHWIIRQYDHEVQGGSVVKPLVGAANDGPSDAAVVRPVLDSRRGLVVACGLNPRYGDFDTYDMAASAIDEAVRNCVAVGANPARIALLDNFCWGNTDRSETLGSLVRAAMACRDMALVLGTPFISGKDSLNNEFHYRDSQGVTRTLSIPPTLLISALGQIDDVAQAVTMDLKEAGNLLYQVGLTRNELGGSHFTLVEGLEGGTAPRVEPQRAARIFAALHKALADGLVRACHDLSEGGLAVAVAEMAFAGGLGARVFLGQVPHEIECDDEARKRAAHLQPQSGDEPLHVLCGMPEATAVLLFSESNTRFLCEVRPDDVDRFRAVLADVPFALVGEVTRGWRLEIIGLPTPTRRGGEPETYEMLAPLVVDADLSRLKQAWQAPLDW